MKKTIPLLALSLLLSVPTFAQTSKKSERSVGEPVGVELVKKLDRILIPEINFKNVTVSDLLDFLALVSRERDPKGLGVNIVNMIPKAVPVKAAKAEAAEADPFDDDFFDDALKEKPKAKPAAEPRVTLNVRRISMKDALDLICEITDTEWKVKKNVVLIRPKGAAPEVKTKFYNVYNPEIIQQMLRDMKAGKQPKGNPWGDPFAPGF